ncbi:MAG: hypothetical protein ABIP20_02875, partial [Chthoniobacteraceae bacterium]
MSSVVQKIVRADGTAAPICRRHSPPSSLRASCLCGESAYFATVSMSWFFTGFTVALCFSTAALIFA